jgi:RNA polymerase sigma-70 factor (ECF subfamily)
MSIGINCLSSATMTKASANSGSGSARRSSTATSRSLLERVKADESDAWNRLVGLYAPLVFHWCQRWHLRDQDAADVFQEVFQSVAQHIRAFRKEKTTDTFRGWLRTITRNKIRDHYRRRHKEPGAVGGSDAQKRLSQLPDVVEPPDDDEVEQQAERGLIDRALELIRHEFEGRTWQAFWRTTVDGMAAKDAGTELGMSPGAVRVAKSRVLHRLRQELGDLAE